MSLLQVCVPVVGAHLVPLCRNAARLFGCMQAVASLGMGESDDVQSAHSKSMLRDAVLSARRKWEEEAVDMVRVCVHACALVPLLPLRDMDAVDGYICL